MALWQKILILAALGIAGTLARYWMQSWVQDLSGSKFAWGTLAVNVLGCFLIGIGFTLAEERFLISRETRFIFSIGFLGAFTTFSSFAFETAAFLKDRQWLFAAGNILLQNVLGIIAVFVGFIVGRLF